MAHAPTDSGNLNDFKKVVDPRMAAELVSITSLHSVLKGLHRAPRAGGTFTCHDIDVMISPYGCFGPPHLSCLKNSIPVIVVRENQTIYDRLTRPEFMEVRNYLEAAGVVASMGAGIDPAMTRAYRAPATINGGVDR